MKKNDYIDNFRRLVVEQLDVETAQATLHILDVATPRVIFDELECHRINGKMHGIEFEKLLTDFFWLFCY